MPKLQATSLRTQIIKTLSMSAAAGSMLVAAATLISAAPDQGLRFYWLFALMVFCAVTTDQALTATVRLARLFFAKRGQGLQLDKPVRLKWSDIRTGSPRHSERYETLRSVAGTCAFVGSLNVLANVGQPITVHFAVSVLLASASAALYVNFDTSLGRTAARLP